MKRETILKIILVLIMGVILFAKPINVFASNLTDLNDLLEDQGSLEDLEQETPKTPEKTETPTTPSTQTQTPNTETTNTTTNQKQELPKAGIAEDTMLGITITALAVVAIYTYKKSNEYKNI